MYKMFYWIYEYHDGIEFKKLEHKVLNSLKNIYKYNVYYIIDAEGNFIVDNRQ